MTEKQFIKKFVPKDLRLAAEDELSELTSDAENRGFEEAITEAAIHLRGVANEMKYW
jgi:hypothetical protein